MVISSPNAAGFEYLVLGEYHNDVNFGIPNYFSATTLRRLFESTGFKVVKLLTPGRLDVQHVRRNVLLMPDKIQIDSFLGQVIFDESEEGEAKRDYFQDFLRKYNLSGSMLVVAQKG